MALIYHAAPGQHHTVQTAWQANQPIVHPDGSLKLDLVHVARILAQNPFDEIKQAIQDLLTRMGIQANMERISREFCKNCEKKTAVRGQA